MDVPRDELDEVEEFEVLRGDIVNADTGKNGSVSTNSTSCSESFPLACLICSHSTRNRFHNDRLKIRIICWFPESSYYNELEVNTMRGLLQAELTVTPQETVCIKCKDRCWGIGLFRKTEVTKNNAIPYQ